MRNKCLTCNNRVESDNIHLPFCSERCRLIDLGDWLSGNHCITEKEHHDIWTEPENFETRH